MKELGERSTASEERVRACIESADSHLYVIEECGRFAACATLCIGRTPEMVIGFVEAVAVLSEMRGKHLGRAIVEHVISECRRLGVMQIHLTSSPKRIAANGLYQRLGFERKETNVYVMKL